MPTPSSQPSAQPSPPSASDTPIVTISKGLLPQPGEQTLVRMHTRSQCESHFYSRTNFPAWIHTPVLFSKKTLRVNLRACFCCVATAYMPTWLCKVKSTSRFYQIKISHTLFVNAVIFTVVECWGGAKFHTQHIRRRKALFLYHRYGRIVERRSFPDSYYFHAPAFSCIIGPGIKPYIQWLFAYCFCSQPVKAVASDKILYAWPCGPIVSIAYTHVSLRFPSGLII